MDRLQAHENTEADRYLQLPACGPRDGGSRGCQARGRFAQPLCAAADGRARAKLAQRCVLCSNRDPAYDFFARRNRVPHFRIDAKKGPFVIDNAFHVQTINSLHDRFERFMEPFRGPATKSLTGYASWFMLGPNRNRARPRRMGSNDGCITNAPRRHMVWMAPPPAASRCVMLVLSSTN
jgi:hypothetical protein